MCLAIKSRKKQVEKEPITKAMVKESLSRKYSKVGLKMPKSLKPALTWDTATML